MDFVILNIKVKKILEGNPQRVFLLLNDGRTVKEIAETLEKQPRDIRKIISRDIRPVIRELFNIR